MAPSPFFSDSSFEKADFAGAKIDDKKFAMHLRNSGALNVP
jgi:hypothetical protein